MAQRVTRHLWLTVLLVAVGLGLAMGTVGGASTRAASHRPGAVSLTRAAAVAAVVPARTEAGTDARTQESPGRSLPGVVALVALAGLVALAAGQSRPPAVGCTPLLVRRYAIALRAPPPFQLA